MRIRREYPRFIFIRDSDSVGMQMPVESSVPCQSDTISLITMP